MHAVTWRTARCAHRIPAAFIAGRRYPPRLRLFHRSTRALQSNEPRDPPASSEQDEKGEHGQGRPGQEAAAAAEVVEVKDTPDAQLMDKLQKGKENVRQLSHALRRASRAKQSADMPPIHIPNWFLKSNVTLREDQKTPLSGVRRLMYWPSEPKPEAKGSLRLHQFRRPPPEEPMVEMAKLSLPLPEKLYAMLEETAAEWGKRTSNGKEASVEYRDILEYVNKVYAKLGVTSAHSEPSAPDCTLHFSVYLEILTAIAGSLSSAHPELGMSFPSAKSNIILHCPADGGIDRLDRLVDDIAIDLDADVIHLDAQDIAELVGDYLGEGTSPSPYSIRSLGYETHRSRIEGYEMDDDEFEDVEAEEDAEDAQDDPIAPAGRTSPATKGESKKRNPPSFTIAGIRTLDASELFRSLNSGAARGSSGRSFMLGDFAPAPASRGTSSEAAARWDDMKLGAYIDALIDASSTKRSEARRSKPSTETESDNSTPTLDTLDLDSAKSDAAKPESIVIGETSEFRLSLDRDQASTARKSTEAPQRTIILIKDYKELSITRQGVRVLDKVTELVQNRRKEGAEIMIVGTTSSSELVPEISRSAIRSLQAENEDSYYRTIVVPLSSTHRSPSIDVPKSLDLENTNWESSRAPRDVYNRENRTRNLAINVRHIQDMIRRLDPTAKQIFRLPPFAFLFEVVPGLELESRVLPFHEMHRLVLTAIGLQRVASDNAEVDECMIQLAMLLLRISDDVKFSWAARERPQLRESRDAASDPSKSAKGPENRIEAVQKTANKHEKKLLNGVINPANIKTTFNDVHAPQETTEALKTMTSLSLQRPDAFSYGVLATDKIPGLLLYGPPGTGKTLLAKAVAKESGATVLEVSGSEVYDMYVGEGEKNVRAIFSLARKLSPCVVFIDEADAIFGSRSGSRHRTSHREVLNQFLKEWDGMNDLSVFIMVATNRPFDMDDAVLRRLPRRLLVDLPTEVDREAILRIHLKGEQLDPGVDLAALAALTPFYSGSDLKNLCVAAALTCVREEVEAAARAKVEQAQAQTQPVDSQTESNSSSSSTPTAEAETEVEVEVKAEPEAELEAEEAEKKGEEPQQKAAPLLPAKRTLHPRHFEKAMQEISASISEDMSSLVAIRKFDEQYGDKRGKRKKSAWGFALAGEGPKESAARVRQ